MLRKIKLGTREEKGPHHEIFADLCGAADDGCDICRRLRHRCIERGINGSEALLDQYDGYVIPPDFAGDRVVFGFEINKTTDVFLELVAVPPNEGTTA